MKVITYFKDRIKASILCIKYPFLYVRNRWTGRHYNNWWIRDKQKDLYQKYHKFVASEEDKFENISSTKGMFYIKELSDNGWYSYWTNWWAKPLEKCLEFCHKILEIIFCIPSYTEFDMIPSGWYKRFGKELREEIYKSLKKHNALYKLRIMDIKETWGHLYMSVMNCPKETYDIIHSYEVKSLRICYKCGKNAVYRTDGYILPYCECCIDESQKQTANKLALYGRYYKFIGTLDTKDKRWDVHDFIKENGINSILHKVIPTDTEEYEKYQWIEHKLYSDEEYVVNNCYNEPINVWKYDPNYIPKEKDDEYDRYDDE